MAVDAVSGDARPPLIATALAGMAVVLLLGAWAVFARMPGGPRDGSELPFSVIAVVTVAMGLLISWRVRRNAVGPLVVAFGVMEAWLVARSAWYWGSTLVPGLIPQPSPLARGLNSGLGGLAFVLLGLIVLLFPTGRLPSRRWRPLAAAVVLTWPLFELALLLDDGPDFAPFENEPPLVADPGPLAPVLILSVAALSFSVLLITIVMGLWRVRRAVGIVRQQLKWVLLGSCLFLFYPFVCGTEVLITGVPQWSSLIVAYLGMVSLPLGVAVGMLRHDLFDVDRVLASTVVWAIVATALVVVFGAAIAAGGALLGGGSPWVAAAATALCAVVLLPLHRLVARTVGRRLYPLRRAALGAVDAVQRRVNSASGEPEELEAELRAAVRDPALRVGYALPDTGELVDAEGEPVPDHGATPIEVGGEVIGALVAPALTSGLRREVAAASIMLVNVVRLRLDVTRSLREVEASRARIVAAEDQARRRFERDLHDGAQQRLVSLGMSLRSAQRRLAGEHVDLTAVLDDAVAELSTAIAELRRLAHGIRPSVLDDGLAAAVESLARVSPVPVSLQLDEVAGVPEPAATTAYYVVAESLANAVKHAAADSIAIRMTRGAETLRVSVRDDGRGGATAGAGGGIAGLGDRVAAAGGILHLESAHGRGTVLEAELPCAS